MRLFSGWARLVGPASIILLQSGCSLSVLDGLSGGSDAGISGGEDQDAHPIVDASKDVASDGAANDTKATSDVSIDAVPSDAGVDRIDGGFDANIGDGSRDSIDADDGAASDGNVATDVADAQVMQDAPSDTLDAPSDGRNCTCTTDGYCWNGECAYRSCKAKLAAAPGSPSGVYWLDVDGEGDGGSAPFRAYCDMVSEGGGYTLVLKVDGTLPTFLQKAALWENDATYRPEFPNLDTNEAKLASFSSVAFTSVRVGILQDSAIRWLSISTSASSLREIMRGSYRATNVGRDAWKNLSTAGSLQLLCNREGFNVSSGANAVRLGVLANEQDSCMTADSWIGFGGDLDGVGFACGNVAHWNPDNGEHDLPFFGYILVR